MKLRRSIRLLALGVLPIAVLSPFAHQASAAQPGLSPRSVLSALPATVQKLLLQTPAGRQLLNADVALPAAVHGSAYTVVALNTVCDGQLCAGPYYNYQHEAVSVLLYLGSGVVATPGLIEAIGVDYRREAGDPSKWDETFAGSSASVDGPFDTIGTPTGKAGAIGKPTGTGLAVAGSGGVTATPQGIAADQDSLSLRGVFRSNNSANLSSGGSILMTFHGPVAHAVCDNAGNCDPPSYSDGTMTLPVGMLLGSQSAQAYLTYF